VQFILLNKTKEINYKIGNIMNEGMENLKEIEELEEDKKTLYKIANKLEQRISFLYGWSFAIIVMSQDFNKEKKDE